MRKVLGLSDYEAFIDELQIPEEEMHTQESNYKVAIMNYTSRRFLDINIGIRDDETDPKHVRARTLLFEALIYFPVYPEGTVIRWSNLSPELLEQVKVPGNIIFEKAFTSTSANLDYTPHDAKEYKLQICHYNGRYIGEFATQEHRHEEEVLIPAFSFFRVDSFCETTKFIELTQLSDEQAEEQMLLAEQAANEAVTQQDTELELDGGVE